MILPTRLSPSTPEPHAQPLRPAPVRGGVKPAARSAIAHGLDPSGTVLAIGADRVALDDVTAYSVDGLAEKDFASNFATAGAFMFAAIVFLSAVAIWEWRERFLLATVLLGLIGLFALIDIRRVRWLTTYTFSLDLRDGRQKRFVTAIEAEAVRLRDALDARIKVQL